jgi:Flp pilus assembly protein TadG
MKKAGWKTWLDAARLFGPDARGAEIAETAMLLPLLFMMLLAIFWFGEAFSLYGTITHAAREGARSAVAPVCATCPASVTTAAQNAQTAVISAINAAHMSTAQLKQPAVAPALFLCGTPPAACGAAAPCDASVTNMCVQTNVQLSSCTATPNAGTCGTSVSFTYQYPYHLPIPYTTLDLGNINLPAQAQMRGESQ